MQHQTSTVEVKPIDKSKRNKILKVTLYLVIITAFEFLIAFTVPASQKYVRFIVFVALTIVKAYYIMSEFMHLGHEKKSLKMSILLPFLFIVFLIFILSYQGQAIYNVLY